MAKRKPGRPKDPLALTEKILVRVRPRLLRAVQKRAKMANRRLATFVRECLEDVVS